MKRRILMAEAVLATAAFGASVLGAACARKPVQAGDSIRTVRAVAVGRAQIPDEIEGFGNLSYLKKVDVVSPSDAVVRSLPFREGKGVGAASIVALLENPQIELAVGRAENALSQAEAALELAEANLCEGKFAAEARLLGLAKSEAELAAARRELAEAERKQADQEKLFEAGGVTEEAIRGGRFSLESGRDGIAIRERALEISRVGFRDADLVAAGLASESGPPLTETGRLAALIELSTRSLSAEAAAAGARRDAARKELESARLAQAELLVIAPISALVGALYVEEGERVEAQAKLLTLIESNSLYAVFPIREDEAPRLEPGMKAIVRVDAAGASIPGVVDMVSPVADAQSASFQVRVRLRGGGKLKPGMFARVVVTVGPPRTVLVIPESAATDRGTGEEGGQARVFVIVDGAAVLREVSLGERTERGVEVIDGLAEGEVVADRPDSELREGEHVAFAD